MLGTPRRSHCYRCARVAVLPLLGSLAALVVCGCGGRDATGSGGSGASALQGAGAGARNGKAPVGDPKVLALAAATDEVLLRKALEATAGAADAGQRGKLLVAIAKAQVESGDAGGALRTAEVIENAEQKAAALAGAAVALAKAGETQRAQEALASARRLVGEGEGDVAKVLVVAQAYLGDVEGAWEQAEQWEFEQPTKKLPLLRALAEAARAAGDDKLEKRFSNQVLGVVEAMQEAGNNVVALTLLATLQSKTGKGEAAHDTLKEALDKARSLPAEDRPMHFLAVATAQGQIEGVDAAKPIFAEALAASDNDRKNAWFRPVFLQQMAGFQAKVGDVEGALETTELIGRIRLRMADLDGSWAADVRVMKAHCWAQVAMAQARAGDWAGAEETLGRVPPALQVDLKDDDALTAYFAAAVLTIAEAMAMLGRRDQAIELIGRVDDVDMKVMASLAAYRGERSRSERLMKAPVRLSLKVEGDFSSGYSWKLDVEPDGTAVLAIDDFAKPVERKFTVSAKQLDELRKLLIEQDFFELGGEYGQRVPDGSTQTITVALADMETTVTLAFLNNWLREDPSKVVEPARALRVWALVRSWFNDPQALDLRKYDQRIIDAADAIDGSGGNQ